MGLRIGDEEVRLDGLDGEEEQFRPVIREMRLD